MNNKNIVLKELRRVYAVVFRLGLAVEERDFQTALQQYNTTLSRLNDLRIKIESNQN